MLIRPFCGCDTGGRVDVVVVAIVDETVESTGTVVSGVVSFVPSASAAVAGNNVHAATSARAIRRGRIMVKKG